MYPKLSAVITISIVLISLIAVGHGERILVVAFWSTKSHKISYDPLLVALAERGHNVTIVSPIPPSKKSVPNIQEIFSVDFDKFMSTQEAMVSPYERKEKNQRSIIPTDFLYMLVKLCAHTLEQPHLLALRKEKFDLILLPMLYNECSAAYADVFNTSTILISPMSVLGHIASILGTPSPISFVPNAHMDNSDSMTFWQRIINLYIEGWIRAIFHLLYVPALERTYREKLNDPNLPGVEELLKKSSLILSNTHISLNKPRPLLPDIIEVGGMHCRQGHPLPKDLEEIVNNSGSDGFILFSLGTALSSSDMPEHKRNQFIEAFGKLKQTVLWKWESDTMPDVPKNVKLSKWLPQQDLLGHPKIKAFITHGGFGSTTEATCHGVPLIGIPMFADQSMNMLAAEKKGTAVKLDYRLITAEYLYDGIQQVLQNSSFKENAKYLSNLLRDQPNGPLERAVFWTEYVIRHNGAPHLRSPARDLNFVQYFSLDVIAFLALVVSLSLGIILVAVTFLFKCVCRVFGKTKPTRLSKTSGKKGMNPKKKGQ